MSILKNPIALSIFNNLKNYIANITLPKFNANNIVTGGTSATLNDNSGIIVYTTAIPSAVPKAYTLTNSKVTALTRITWSIVYSPLGDEAVVPCYYQAQTGSITFYVGILNGTASESSIEIDFQILNP